MNRTHKSTTFSSLIPGGLPTVQGQGADTFAPFNPAPAPKLERLFTIEEAGAYLRLSGPRTLYREIAEGRLIASWIGKNHMISESNLAAYVQSQSRPENGRKHNVPQVDSEAK